VVCLVNGKRVRLDDVLDGSPAMLTARRPDSDLLAFCRRYGIVPVRVTAEPAGSADTGWVHARLTPGEATGLQALAEDSSIAVLVRPDRVIAAVATRSEPPRLPWTTP
jgi:hypothetical protein